MCYSDVKAILCTIARNISDEIEILFAYSLFKCTLLKDFVLRTVSWRERMLEYCISIYIDIVSCYTEI